MVSDSQVIRALGALAQPVRLQVFRALVVAGQAGLTPGTMAESLDIPANTLSFHLKELGNSGLVHVERDGRFLIYKAQYDRMAEVIAYLTENCCQGDQCAFAASECRN
jgi:ArsR family transcriptional regulator